MFHLSYAQSRLILNKGNNKITEHRAIFQRESQNSYKQTKSFNNRETGKPQWPWLGTGISTEKWWIESDFTASTSRFHYGSKVPVVTITAFITILEQNRENSSQTVLNSVRKVSNISREPSPSITMSPLKYFNYDSIWQKHFYVTHSQKIFLTL